MFVVELKEFTDMSWSIIDHDHLATRGIQRGEKILKYFHHHELIHVPLDQMGEKGVVPGQETQRIQTGTPGGFQFDRLALFLPSIGDVGLQGEPRFIEVIEF